MRNGMENTRREGLFYLLFIFGSFFDVDLIGVGELTVVVALWIQPWCIAFIWENCCRSVLD